MKRMSLALLLAVAIPVFANDVGDIDKEAVGKILPKRPYSPYAGRNYPTRPLFGDTHLHTSFSMDGGAAGARLGPVEAYRFAKGEEITASSGQQAKLSRPLDFLVVADHSDGLGFFPLLIAGDPKILGTAQGRKWYDMIQDGKGVEAALDLYFTWARARSRRASFLFPAPPRSRMPGRRRSTQPKKPTTLAASRRSSASNGPRAPAATTCIAMSSSATARARASMIEPFTAQKPLGSDNPRDLWKYMAAYEAKTGGKALAIAHNGNGSNGRMFPIIESFTGKKIDREYAENRRRWEPLYEVTQMKGTSEAHPFLSKNDEFASFEIWDKGNLDVSAAKKPEMLEFEYARAAFKNGLKMEGALGVNPYKFGLVGSTDSHTGLAAVEEDNFFGKTSGSEPSPTRAEHPFIKNPDTGITSWAGKRQRPDTPLSGRPRTRVRPFGMRWSAERLTQRLVHEWSCASSVAGTSMRRMHSAGCRHRSATPRVFPWAATSRRRRAARPRLSSSQRSRIPSARTSTGFRSSRDGWTPRARRRKRSTTWSGAIRRPASPMPSGKLPAVGDTVDVPNATWTNTIGDPELITVWTDPDFDAAQSAFYYARVIEIPTPRWTAYDAKFYKLQLPKEVPMKQQERAYTSPIWYTP